MKQKRFFASVPGKPALLVLALTFGLVLAGCNNGTNGTAGKPSDETSTVYNGFYNYPTGREKSGGTLQIRNTVAAPVLLFTSEVSKDNYIGTVGSLSSINVGLPEEKFYTIVAVKKSEYEDKGAQAAQFSDLTYFSNTQPYSLAIQASEMGGAGQWIITNNTDYWVTFMKSDQSGTVYAVAAPRATRIIIPVAFNKSYDFIPHFYRQLKYNGNIVALVEFDDPAQQNTIFTDSQYPNNRTTIGGTGNINPTGSTIKPAVLFTNSSDKNVRIYLGQNNQLTNGGMVGSDFVVVSGRTFMFSSTEDDTVKKLEAGVSTSSITFEIPGQSDVFVSQDITMENNKVYHVTLSGTVNTSYKTTVIEEDASVYFN
jgi:hypothetical protein